MEDELALLDDGKLLEEVVFIVLRVGRPFFTSLIYLSALLVLDVSLGKAIVVAMAVAVFRIVRFGNRWLEKIGFVLIVSAGAVWVGIAPPAKEWRTIGASFVHQIMTEAKAYRQPHAS